MPDQPAAPLKGRLLIASPAIKGEDFQKSVVLLADHSPTGAYGLVLNHPANQSLGDFIDEEKFAPLRHLSVYHGGPVSKDHLTFAAFWLEGEHFRYATRISLDEAIERSRQHGTLVRAFVGYSGWNDGQLENELKHNSWFVLTPDADLLRKTHDRSLWAALLRPISPYHHIIAEAPDNPILN